MFSVRVDINDLIKLNKQIKHLITINQNNLCRDIASETAQNLLADIKSKTPVDTGRLLNNWTLKERELPSGYEIIILNNTSYAHYVEYGHKQKTKHGFKWIGGIYMLSRSCKNVRPLLKSISLKSVSSFFRRFFKF